MTHFSPLTGESDTPESSHTLDYRLTNAGDRTRVTLDQDGNDSEAQAASSRPNWQAMLDQLKGYVENGRASS